MELFKQATGAFMVHIPYRGIAPAITDLMGGQTQAMFPGLAAALPHLGRPHARAGRDRASAQPAAQGRSHHGGVGFKGFDAMQWYGVVGPAKMPEAVVKTPERIADPGAGATRHEAKLSTEAIELVQMSPEQFGTSCRSTSPAGPSLPRKGTSSSTANASLSRARAAIPARAPIPASAFPSFPAARHPT
jgi:tripartite-type tricarboxylate transporter receptor subunit TctC